MILEGDSLVEYMSHISLHLESAKLQTDTPIYKDFDDLLIFLLDAARKYGGNLKKILRPIRESLLSDLKWEKKLLREYKEGLFQFILTGVITWVFAYFSSWILEVKISIFIISLILGFQFLGLIIFHFSIIYFEKKIFSLLFSMNHKLIRFESLLNAHLSVQEILEKSEISHMDQELMNVEMASLWGVVLRLVRKWKNYGECIIMEVIEVRSEISFKFEQKFETFLDKVKLLKFLVLVIFFLTPYFIMVGGILESFLIE